VNRRLVLFLALVLATGCASVPAPDSLQAMRAREAEGLPEQSVQSVDRYFRARVPARLAGEILEEEEGYGLALDIGTGVPIECWVNREDIDFAAALLRSSDRTFAVVSERSGEIDLRRVDRVDSGAIAGNPFIAIDWLYRVQTDAGPRIGHVKHLVASKKGRGLYCQHNEPGYAGTFRRVVSALLESLEFGESNGPQPYFSEISTMSVRGMRVGVGVTTLSLDADRDTRIYTWSAVLIPITDSELQASDTAGVEFARPDGTLINQVHIESANGEVVSNLKLDPEPDGSWQVEGMFQGKPLSARIESASPPSSWLGDAVALRAALAGTGTGAEITLPRWVPEADPTRFIDQTLVIGQPVDPEHFAAKLAAAGLEADLVVDREGTVAAGTINMGAAVVELEQVYIDGSF